MVLTAVQRTAFFRNNDQMALTAATRTQLQTEGITDEVTLGEASSERFDTIKDNLRRPPGGGPPFEFTSKSEERLRAASNIVKYYNLVGREPTADNMMWDPVIKIFKKHWDDLKKQQVKDAPEVPKISKSLPIITWITIFKDFLFRVVGTNNIPLSYIVRDDEDVPNPIPELMDGKPYSEQYGSVMNEMVALATHDHEGFVWDNHAVFGYLEEATRSTTYADILSPYRSQRDGKGAFRALITHHAGEEKWDKEVMRLTHLLVNRQWKGQNNYTLESFINSHRNAFVTLQECAKHVNYQLPTERDRVKFLVEAIKCSDAGMQAAISTVRSTAEMKSDFSKAAAHLMIYDPVAARRANKTVRAPATVAATLVAGDPGDTMADEDEIVEVSSATQGKKPAIGKTGVQFRYYKREEFKQLTPDQKQELIEWRRANGNGGGGNTGGGGNGNKSKGKGKGPKTYTKRQISAMIKQAKKKEEKDNVSSLVAAVEKLVANQTTNSNNKRAISSVEAADQEDTKPPATTLRSILKRAKGNNQA